MRFDWDADNLRHVLIESSHGVTPDLVEEIADGAPRFVVNLTAVGRIGSHKMIGPNARGRFWTIVLIQINEERWRPIMGWPSTGSEMRIYGEAAE